MHFSTLLTFAAAASGAVAAPTAELSQIQKRAVVPHDSLWPMRENVRPGTEGSAIWRYKPYLHIAHGCQPYTAVDDNGNTSGGLQNTGGATAGCRDDRRGQTYARGAWHKGRYAIMYSFYFPKDQIVDGGGNAGHRHDWESVVIVIDNPANQNPRVLGAGASGHGDYKITRNPQMRDGGRLQVEYFTNFPRNHEFQFKTSPGRNHWMVDWARLSEPARRALQDTSFDRANVPFKNGNFEANLDRVYRGLGL